MNNRRIQRLLGILQILQTGKRYNVTDLVEQTGVSRRTVFRDLETLRTAGVGLNFDAKLSCYFLEGPAALPATSFTPAEALALLVVARQYTHDSDVPLITTARHAADKIEASLPAALRDEMADMSRAISVRAQGAHRPSGDDSVYATLVEARRLGRAVSLRYQSLTEWQTIRTRLRPYQLLFCRHSWYVIGRSSLHHDVRTFKLQRIVDLKLLSERFRVPSSFRLNEYLGNAWTMVPEAGPDLKVVIRFTPLVAHNVAEVVWHATQQLAWQDDGSLVFRARVSGINEISWWILGYGDQAEVLGPARLRKLVAQRVAGMCRLYHDRC